MKKTKRHQYYVWQFRQAIQCDQDVLQEPDAVIKLNKKDNAEFNRHIRNDDNFAIEGFTRYLQNKYDLGGGISISPTTTQQELCLKAKGGKQELIDFQNRVALKEALGEQEVSNTTLQ